MANPFNQDAYSSDAWPRDMEGLGRAQDVPHRSSRTLSALHGLTQTLSKSLDEEAMIKAVCADVPLLVEANLIGIARANRERVWVWSDSNDCAWEARVRRYLHRRLGHVPSSGASSHTPLRLIRRTHLYLVPPPIVDPSVDEGFIEASCEIALDIGMEEAGILLVQRKSTNPFTDEERQVLDTVGAVLSLSFAHTQVRRRLEDGSLRDALTGVLNRQAFERALTRELRLSHRYGVPACLLLIDLDYFATVNDRLGHAAGDHVLRMAADFIRTVVRDVDVIGRYEGEAFGVLLPHTDRERATVLAERLREAIEQHLFMNEDGQVRATISIGLAMVPNAEIASIAEWMTAAQSAVHRAKIQGRNCVVNHMPGPPALAQAAVMSLAA